MITDRQLGCQRDRAMTSHVWEELRSGEQKWAELPGREMSVIGQVELVSPTHP